MRTLVPVDRWDAHYAAGRDFRPVLDEEETVFDHRVGPGQNRCALDVGCGTGGFARFLHTRHYTVHAIDYAEAAIDLATARSADTPGITFEQRNAETDPWADLPPFDLITCRLSYAFIQNKQKFLHNVGNHLTSGGMLYVMTPLADTLPAQRRETGITPQEIEELHDGWTTVEQDALDAQHTAYTLTR
ncbi:class I SAM-dependent methyltransferase [Streptomyces sp. NPDC003327]